MEQVGTIYKGSTTYKNLMKSSLGPTDVIACVLKGNAAVSYPMGAAMVDDPSNAGCKKRYTNGAVVTGEAVATGDGSTTTFDLDNSDVVPGTLVGKVNGVVWVSTLSKGTGTDGKDQIIFEDAPTAVAITADYTRGASMTGACILMTEEATVVGGPNITCDGLRDGSVNSAMVVDSAGNAVDAAFKAALPRVSFD